MHSLVEGITLSNPLLYPPQHLETQETRVMVMGGNRRFSFGAKAVVFQSRNHYRTNLEYIVPSLLVRFRRVRREQVLEVAI